MRVRYADDAVALAQLRVRNNAVDAVQAAMADGIACTGQTASFLLRSAMVRASFVGPLVF